MDLILSNIYLIQDSIVGNSAAISTNLYGAPRLVSTLSIILICLLTILTPKKQYLFWMCVVVYLLSVSYRYMWLEDDLFSNFLTSYNFSKYNIFSISRFERQEGSVEYFFYFLVSILGGANKKYIVYSSFILSAIFYFLAFFYVWKITLKVTKDHAYSNLLVIFSLISSSYITGNIFCGYGYGLFAFIYFVSIYLYLFSGNKLGLFLLAILPLIRIEGIFVYPIFVILTYFLLYRLKDLDNIKLFHSIYVVSFVAQFIGRYLYYGYFFPVPGVSKQSPLFYLPAWEFGLGRLTSVSYPIFFLLLIGILLLLLKLKFFKDIPTFSLKKCLLHILSNKKVLLTIVPLYLLTFVYKVNGGDFLPMNRYDILFYFSTLLLVIYLLSIVIKNQIYISIFIISIFIIGISDNPYTSFKYPSNMPVLQFIANLEGIYKYSIDPAKIIEKIGYRKNITPTTLVKTDKQIQEKDNNRINTAALKSASKNIENKNFKIFDLIPGRYKEGLAIYFNNLYPDVIKKIVIVELSTFSYYSNHKIFDMFGTTNKEIAFTDPFPRVDIYGGFKKRNPKLLEKYNADIIIGFYTSTPPNKVEMIKKANHLDYKYYGWTKGSHEYMLGGEKYLTKLGYVPCLLVFNDDVSFSFRIKKDQLEDFENRLKNNYSYSKIETRYSNEVNRSSLLVEYGAITSS